MTLDRNDKPIQNPRTTSRAFDDETVVIDPTTNFARMLNGVGTRIWELSDGYHTIADIATILETEYTVSTSEALLDVTFFVEELVRRELVTLTSSS
jgi:hypothetical protein